MSMFDDIMEGYIQENSFETVNESACGNLNGLYIQVTPDPGRNYDVYSAYFKCADHSNINSKDTNFARISFGAPQYIDHGEKSFTLKSKHKKTLMKLLKMEDKEHGTVWNKMIYEFNRQVKSRNSFQLPLNLPIPDYNKL